MIAFRTNKTLEDTLSRQVTFFDYTQILKPTKAQEALKESQAIDEKMSLPFPRRELLSDIDFKIAL